MTKISLSDMEITLTKTLSGLIPADKQSQDWYAKLKTTDMVHGDFKKVRSAAHHRKYFALLNIGYENWEPGEINSKYGTPEKNFDRFRKDVIILAGFYEPLIRLDGTVRIEPKSISFASMDQEEFNELYSRTIDVLLKYVYKSGLSAKDLDEIVEKYLSFI